MALADQVFALFVSNLNSDPFEYRMQKCFKISFKKAFNSEWLVLELTIYFVEDNWIHYTSEHRNSIELFHYFSHAADDIFFSATAPWSWFQTCGTCVRVAKCQRYGRYICVKILEGWGKKCRWPRRFVKWRSFGAHSTNSFEVLSLNKLPRGSHVSQFHSIQVLDLSQFMCFSWGEIWFDLCKKFDISQLGHVFYWNILTQPTNLPCRPGV